MEKRQLEVANKAEFLKLLDAISKINDSGVILDLQEAVRVRTGEKGSEAL